MGRRRQYATATELQRAKRARNRSERVYRLDSPRQPVVAVVDHADHVGALVVDAILSGETGRTKQPPGG